MAKILVIEDNPVHYEVLVNVLGQRDYEFISARRIEDGRQLARTMSPELIILDIIFFGELNAGFELCKELKSNPETKDIPVLIVTRRTLNADMDIAKEVGANEFLGKPYSPRDLREKVRKLLQQTSASRRKFTNN